jgi:anaerobic selenocysteine-containing dehydrogenase
MSAADAATYNLPNGDWVRVESRRGKLEAQIKLGDIASGRLFIPFHYGYWDDPERMHAANELTLFESDAVSKQPHYKYAAVAVPS